MVSWGFLIEMCQAIVWRSVRPFVCHKLYTFSTSSSESQHATVKKLTTNYPLGVMKKCCIFLKLLEIQDGCTGLPLNHLNGFLMGHKPKFGILFLKGTQLLKFCIIGRHISNEIVKPYSELFTVSRIMWCPAHYFVQQSYHALLCIALFIKKKIDFWSVV